MRLAPIAALLSLVALLALTATDADAAKKKKKASVLKGSVVSVTAASGTTPAKLTVKVGGKKNTAGKEEQVTVANDAKIERVTGKKGQQQTTAATFDAVRAGAKVTVHVRAGGGHVADRIEIKGGKKKVT